MEKIKLDNVDYEKLKSLDNFEVVEPNLYANFFVVFENYRYVVYFERLAILDICVQVRFYDFEVV